MPKGNRRSRGTTTILDVASAAGVSSMTVSRVVNGATNVRPSTRDLVLETIARLNYSPNTAARSLAAGHATHIGLFYANPSDAYLTQFLVGALDGARRAGCHLVLEVCEGETPEAQAEATRRFASTNVEGVILPPPLCDSRQTKRELDLANITVVAVATGAPVADVSSVRIDDYQGASAMTQHLLDLGHTAIALIKGDPKHTPAVLRAQGFIDTMARAGLTVPTEHIVPGLFTYRSGLAAASTLLKLKNRPTAILSSNDDMAAAVVAVAHGMGLRVPGDLSVTGFDDTPVATTIWPTLTTIHQPVTAMGRTAVRLMLEEIRCKRSGKPKAGNHQVMKYSLVKRESSAAPPRG